MRGILGRRCGMYWEDGVICDRKKVWDVLGII